MGSLTRGLSYVNDVVWGWPTMILLAGVGLWLTFRLRGLQLRLLPKALGRGTDKATGEEGDISSFQALMTALPNLLGILGLTPVIVMLTYSYVVERGDRWESFKG